jgi:hypothetical protein
MARKPETAQNETVVLVGEIPLPASTIKAIADSVGQPDMSDGKKVLGVACGLLQSLARGGIMLAPELVERINEAKGSPAGAEEIADLVDQACSRSLGKYSGVWELDPAYYSALEEISRMTGLTPQELVDNMMNTAMDEEWLYKVDPRPARILMTPTDKAEIEELLGIQFSNGADLANAIRSFTGQNFLQEVGR